MEFERILVFFTGSLELDCAEMDSTFENKLEKEVDY